MAANNTDRELLISRLLNAPRQLVWDVWTKPEHIAQWWGPEGFTSTIHTMDVSAGGEWDFIMHGPDGTNYKNKVIYIEVEAPERIVYDHISTPKFRVSVSFEEQGNKTLITMRSEFESAEALKKVIEVFKADVGMKQNMDRMESFVENNAANKNFGAVTKEADGYKVSFERKLQHPANAVWEAITDPEKLSIWFTDIDMDPVEGGKMTIRFRDEQKTESFGKITKMIPNKLFEFLWEDELAVWEIFPESDSSCRLVFTYSKVPEQYAMHVPVGWHVLLDQLETVLDGHTEPYAFGTETPESDVMKTRYAARLQKDFPQLKNNNMNAEPIIVEHVYNAPASTVWKALTDREQMKQWYFDIAEFKAEPGFQFQFTGGAPDGIQYIHLSTVKEVIENKKLSYSWRYEGYEGDSLVTFELFEEDGKTRVRLTHEGLETFPANPDFARKNFEGGWSEIVGKMLKEFVEKA